METPKGYRGPPPRKDLVVSPSRERDWKGNGKNYVCCNWCVITVIAHPYMSLHTCPHAHTQKFMISN